MFITSATVFAIKTLLAGFAVEKICEASKSRRTEADGSRRESGKNVAETMPVTGGFGRLNAMGTAAIQGSDAGLLRVVRLAGARTRVAVAGQQTAPLLCQ